MIDDGHREPSNEVARLWPTVPLLLTIVGLALGAAMDLGGRIGVAHVSWTVVTAVGVLYSLASSAVSLRHRRVGVDLIALLALVGAIFVREYLAGSVISVMLTSGGFLEAWAAGRARRELRALLQRAPRSARRYVDDQITPVALQDVRPGDRLMVVSGEVVPVDGTVLSQACVLDESALTGEPLPVVHERGDAIRSGVVNASNAFDMAASATADESTYASIVRLVAQAESSPAPFVRLADQYAVGFLAVTLIVTVLAWLVGGATRAVAVLVVATPCPMILAAPVAFVSGLSCAAHRGVVIKGGAVLEQLARCTTVLFDKTGTLTEGHPRVVDVVGNGTLSSDEILTLAGSLDQASPHVLASAVVRSALDRGLVLTIPRDVREEAGVGIKGTVGDRHVAVGQAALVGLDDAAQWAKSARRSARLDGALNVFVGVDDKPVGVITFDDPLRSDARRTIQALRDAGMTRVVMVTGDRSEVAETVGAVVGVDEVMAQRTPAEKLDVVRLESGHASTIMIGDGINDAPALALANVGVAMGARGATAASEAADVVLTVDRLDRLGEAVQIARRSRRIAVQSVTAGMAMSLVAMGFAAAGLLPAVWGALFQEVIDAATIFNALRALRGRTAIRRLSHQDGALAERFRDEHRAITSDIEQLRTIASDISSVPSSEVVAMARRAQRLLVEKIVPHEEAEERILYPAIKHWLGEDEPVATMSRAHVEIGHQVRRLGQLIDDIDPLTPDAADLNDLRGALYGLAAILALHTTQEEESFLSRSGKTLVGTPD